MKIIQPVMSSCIMLFKKLYIFEVKVFKVLHINVRPWMLIIVYINQSVVSVVLHYYMLRNKQFRGHSLYNMTSVVVLFAYLIKLNISTTSAVTKILPKRLYCCFKDLHNESTIMLSKIWFHKHFKECTV